MLNEVLVFFLFCFFFFVCLFCLRSNGFFFHFIHFIHFPHSRHQGKKWVIENQENNTNIVIEDGNLKQTVYIFKWAFVCGERDHYCFEIYFPFPFSFPFSLFFFYFFFRSSLSPSLSLPTLAAGAPARPSRSRARSTPSRWTRARRLQVIDFSRALDTSTLVSPCLS